MPHGKQVGRLPSCNHHGVVTARPIRLTEDDAVALVMRKHHLDLDLQQTSVLRVIEDLVGLHATNGLSPFLQLRARVRDFAAMQLDAVLDGGRAAKVPCMRNTLFIEPARRVPMVLAATRRLKERGRGRYMAANGLTAALYERLASRVEGELRGRALEVRELQSTLDVKPSLSPIVILMCDDARLVRWRGPGGWRSGRPTYRRLEEVISAPPPEQWDEQAAVSGLVDWYVRRYGPVTEEDVAWWTGLPVRPVRDAIVANERIIEATVGSSRREFLIHERDLAWTRHPTRPSADQIFLLPVLDPYLQGFRHRERIIDPKHQPFVVDKGGNATSVILIAGRAAGVWDLADHARPEVRLFFFDGVASPVRRRVHVLATEVGAFISQRSVSTVEVDNMKPLVEERAGAVLSPLTER